MKLDRAIYESPLGPILVLAQGDRLVGTEFAEPGRRAQALEAHLTRWLGPYQVVSARDPAGAVSRLATYFQGEIAALDDQPMTLHGTAFQQKVWRELRRIRAGATRSYGELAARVGAPHAARAVGAANGANPISLFVPCHRAIAADGSLHGYGGGLERKAWLLAHEGARTGSEREIQESLALR